MARTPGARPVLPKDANYSVRQARALELRVEGYSQVEIAHIVGVHPSNVSRMIKKAMRERQAQGVDAMRDLEEQRLDTLQAMMWALAKQGDTKAAAVVARLLDRRAKMFGLDAEAGLGGGALHHNYFVFATIYVGSEAEAALRHLRAEVADELPYSAGNLVHEVTFPLPAGATEQQAIALAEQAASAIIPEQPVTCTAIVLHHEYVPVRMGGASGAAHNLANGHQY